MSAKSRKILIGLGVLVVTLFVLYGISLARSKARLRAAYAALEQDGRPMDANEVLGSEVPDAQNAALLYERAAALIKAESVNDKDLLEYLGKRAGKFLSGSLEPDERADFERWIQQDVVTEALSVVKEGNQRPACRFSRADEVALHPDLPIEQELRSLGAILNAHAYLAAQQGRSDEAWETIGVELKLAHHVLSDPLTPGPWTRFALIGLGCRAVRTLCEIAPPDERACKMLETLLRDLDAIEPFIRVVDAERLAVGERILKLPEDQLYTVLRNDPWSGRMSGPDVLVRLYFRFITYKPRFLAAHANYLQVMRKSVQLLEGPYMSHESPACQELRDLADRYPLTSSLSIFSYGLKSIHCRLANDVRATRAGLALLRYKQAHDAFPTTLEALDLDGLVDSYNKEPLHYRAEGDGFIVYSVAEDLKDNGGQLERRRRSSDPRDKKEQEFDRGWRFSETPTASAEEEMQGRL